MKKPCRTARCREEQKQRRRVKPPKVVAENRAPIDPGVQVDPKILNSETEGSRLWKWNFVGTSTAIAMMESFARLKVPGGSIDHVNSLISRLAEVVKLLNENQTPSQ